MKLVASGVLLAVGVAAQGKGSKKGKKSSSPTSAIVATTGAWTPFKDFATGSVYDGPQGLPTGMVHVFSNQDGTATVKYDLGKLDGTSGGLHIHAGTSCDDANDSAGGYTGNKGHYYDAENMETDPWNTSWMASDGAGSASFTVDTGLSFDDLADKVIVLHDSTGAKAACAVLKTTSATTGAWTPFKDFATGSVYDGPQGLPTGMVHVFSNQDGTATVKYDLGKLDGTSGGLHIHAGTSCDDANDSAGGYTGNKGHYYDAENMETDPWNTSWMASDGAGSASFTVDTGLSFEDLADKVIVLHDSTGAKAACAVLQDNSATVASPVTTPTRPFFGFGQPSYPTYFGRFPGRFGRSRFGGSNYNNIYNSIQARYNAPVSYFGNNRVPQQSRFASPAQFGFWG